MTVETSVVPRASGPVVITFDKQSETPLPGPLPHKKRERNVSEGNLTSFTGDLTEEALSEDSSSSFDGSEEMVAAMESTVISGKSLLGGEVDDGELKVSDSKEDPPTEINSSEEDEPELVLEMEDPPPVAEVDTSLPSLPETPVRRRSAIKKFNPLEIPVKEHRSSWKQLPKPDLNVIRATSAPAVLLQDAATRAKNSVSFDEVRTREYRQTLGDNPSVSYGPPIALDWGYEELPSINVEEYEGSRGPRRDMRQMMMNYYMRRNLLKWGCGFSENQLKDAEKQANKVKRLRSVTRTLLPAQKLEEAVQSVARKTKRLGKGKRKSSTSAVLAPQDVPKNKLPPLSSPTKDPIRIPESSTVLMDGPPSSMASMPEATMPQAPRALPQAVKEDVSDETSV